MGAAFVVAYAAGMFPTAVLVGHRIGHDPTSEGSGNPGATNIYRLGGRLAGVAVALGDMAKGALPVGATLLLWDRPEAMAAWIGAVAGHAKSGLYVKPPSSRGLWDGVIMMAPANPSSRPRL